jgi:purine-binding chemotaxis protein CheW
MSALAQMVSEARTPERELVAFRLAGQELALDIMAVREIRGWTPVTPMPESPPYLLGIVNLRGLVLPIVDLAQRLGLPSGIPTSRNAIIVVQIGSRTVGLLVEGVTGIMSIDCDLIQPTPVFGGAGSRSVLEGVITTEGRMIGLLGLDSLFLEDAGGLMESGEFI